MANFAVTYRASYGGFYDRSVMLVKADSEFDARMVCENQVARRNGCTWVKAEQAELLKPAPYSGYVRA